MDKIKDREKFGQLMAMLAVNCSKENTKERLELYFHTLSDFSIEEVESGITSAIRTIDKAIFPPVGQLRQLIEGTPDSRALLAWRIAVETRSHYYGADFSEDPVIAYCIEELCDTYLDFTEKTLDELKWLEKRFLDLYRMALKRPDVLVGRSPILYGHFQIDDQKKELPVRSVPRIEINKIVKRIEAPKVKALE